MTGTDRATETSLPNVLRESEGMFAFPLPPNVFLWRNADAWWAELVDGGVIDHPRVARPIRSVDDDNIELGHQSQESSFSNGNSTR